MVPHANVGAPDLILLRDVADAFNDSVLTQRLVHLQVTPQTDVLRYSSIRQLIQGLR